MPRLLMTTDMIGGVWRYSVDLARALRNRRYDVTLAVLGPCDAPALAVELATDDALRIHPLPLALDWLAHSVEDVELAAQGIADLAARLDVDLVQLHSPAYAAFDVFRHPVVAVNHSCVGTWWAALRDEPMPADLAWRAALVQRGLAAARASVAPSSAFASFTAKVYDLPRAPVAVANGVMGVTTAAARVCPTKAVFSAGRLWDEAKNAVALDRAAPYIDAPVMAAGSSCRPDGSRICLDQIELLGQLSPQKMREWLDRRPVYVSTSRYEPFGLSVLEAAQSGCALVLNDIATFRENWDGAALFANASDPHGFATAVNSLLADPERRETYASRAAVRAARFTVDATACAMELVYASALRGGQPAACEAAA